MVKQLRKTWLEHGWTILVPAYGLGRASGASVGAEPGGGLALDATSPREASWLVLRNRIT
jgi:hypothetical protein